MISYALKIFRDYIDVIPALLSTLLLGFYDPIKAGSSIKSVFSKRK